MFTSRLIEKAALSQIVSHLKNTGLYAKYNSTYRAHYTTKTFLTKIHSDIMNNFDKQNLTLLVMLDLSASFDTIDLNILINTIESRFNIIESSLQWFISYLMNHNQRILINNTSSNDASLKLGVPQGSCARPIAFLIYISQLYNIIGRHLPISEAYTNDTQFYIKFKPKELTTEHTIDIMERCIQDVRS